MAKEKEGKQPSGSENCIFCSIAKKEIKGEIVYESENFVAFPDIHPKTTGHTLIIPKKHYTNLIDLPESLGSELLDTLKKVFEIRARQGAEGFNIVMNNFPAAGQLVMHAHLHLLPRKTNDNKGLGL